jgi:hypothetical protein|tara:strand:- start:40 stop:363 length:324 start_codon:yes stop_codon:yes gene_type:complete
MPNNYKNEKVNLGTNTETVLYTCPGATTATIRSILVCDTSGSGDAIDITITDADASAFSLFKSKAISANDTRELLSEPLVVQENEIIKVTATTASRLHVVASLLEVS